MNSCCVCGASEKPGIALCLSCRDDITSAQPLCPEQVVSQPVSGAAAAFLDQWGRVHELRSTSVAGRHKADQICLLESSVSRHHAELRYEVSADKWTLRDLGSTNGTWVNAERIVAPMVLLPKAIVWFGQVGFYFIAPLETHPRGHRDSSLVVRTRRHDSSAEPLDDDEEVGERTHGGLPQMRLELFEPVGGGGGFLVAGQTRVHLSPSQLALMRVLVDRMIAQEAEPEMVRGFVRSVELITELPWDTRHPDDNHLKQLVRRLRRALAAAQLDSLLESRHGLGYRLRVRPIGGSSVPDR